jgi:taurine dioxygenase
MTTATIAAPAIARQGTLGSIKAEPLTCTIGAELSNVNLGAASRDAGLVAEIRALLLKHKVLFFRDQDITRAEHVAFARHFGELEDHPVAERRTIRSGADLQDPEHPTTATRLPAPTRHGAKPPFGACSAASSARRWWRHDVGKHGAATRLPDRPSNDRHLRALFDRGHLRRGDADQRLALRRSSRRRTSGGAHASETGEKVLFVNTFTTHFTNCHTPENVRVGQDARRQPAAQHLIAGPFRIPGALPLEAEQHGDVGQPQHATLRGDGLPAVPPQDGARRNHRRQALLTATHAANTDDSLFRRFQ